MAGDCHRGGRGSGGRGRRVTSATVAGLRYVVVHGRNLKMIMITLSRYILMVMMISPEMTIATTEQRTGSWCGP